MLELELARDRPRLSSKKNALHVQIQTEPNPSCCMRINAAMVIIGALRPGSPKSARGLCAMMRSFVFVLVVSVFFRGLCGTHAQLPDQWRGGVRGSEWTRARAPGSASSPSIEETKRVLTMAVCHPHIAATAAITRHSSCSSCDRLRCRGSGFAGGGGESGASEGGRYTAVLNPLRIEGVRVPAVNFLVDALVDTADQPVVMTATSRVFARLV